MRSHHSLSRTVPDAPRARGGFTLVELLVAIGLFAVIATIASGGFISALRTQRRVASLISAESNVTLVLEQMAREERTGYLFCHDLNTNSANTPSSACGPCTISDSGQAAPSAPSEDWYQGTKDLAVWTCPAIHYYTAEGHEVTYSLQNGQLMRQDLQASDTSPVALTGSDVVVKYLAFRLFGNLEGDHWTPRITISIGIAPSSTDPAVANDVLPFQTTVSARQIDCGSVGC